MHIRAFVLALASLFIFLTPSFAACSLVLGPRDVDRPIASKINANRVGPVLDGADYTDWETIAYTTPLSVTSGGFILVPVGWVDGAGKGYPLSQKAACDAA